MLFWVVVIFLCVRYKSVTIIVIFVWFFFLGGIVDFKGGWEEKDVLGFFCIKLLLQFERRESTKKHKIKQTKQAKKPHKIKKKCNKKTKKKQNQHWQ